ncbi:MAG: peptidoglycan DD-metalloendopeptidase family protein [Deltaproteobacteria bacterium]|nr:peptidoglycan DD-metalloendopeptidase family protein [Deltaproteobacteria bacterium]MBW2152240.1 peptidoglycan DD-metalloendopeptidase family protein [Deltaproteobacteria bacterium]
METLNSAVALHRKAFSAGKLYILYFMIVPAVFVSTDGHGFSKNSFKSDCVEYGIPLDSLQVVKDVVRRNQNLAKILLAYNVPYATIHEVAMKSKDVFDVRKIKAGNPYCVLHKPEPEKRAIYFIYEQDPINYVVYDLNHPADVYPGEKTVDVKIRATAGVIHSSLYNAVYQMGFGYEMVERLSDLYAWTIDFHHLQKGDNFRIIFEEKYAGTTRVGMGKILAARFHTNGTDYDTFYFEAGGRGGYYDENGNSMEKAFLKAPLKYTRITSRPSRSRLHPILKVHRPHLGTDYAAPKGTPVHAVGDGVVLNAGYRRGYGKYVTIKHGSEYKTEYLHLSRIKKGISKGAHVSRGDVIGYVGSTGLATGLHLDFRFWKNGRIFDHVHRQLPAGKPLEEKYLKTFRTRMGMLRNQLNSIPFYKTINLVQKGL